MGCRMIIQYVTIGLLFSSLQAQSITEVRILSGVDAIDKYVSRLAEAGKAKQVARVFVEALSREPNNLNLLYGASRAVLEVSSDNGHISALMWGGVRLFLRGSEINYRSGYTEETEMNEWKKFIEKSIHTLEKTKSNDIMLLLSKVFFIQVFGDSRIRVWSEEVGSNPKGVRIRTNVEEVLRPYWSRIEQIQPNNVHFLKDKLMRERDEKNMVQIARRIYKNIDQLDSTSRRDVLNILASVDKNFETELESLLLRNPTHPANLFFVLNSQNISKFAHTRNYLPWFSRKTGIEFRT